MKQTWQASNYAGTHIFKQNCMLFFGTLLIRLTKRARPLTFPSPGISVFIKRQRAFYWQRSRRQLDAIF